MKNLQKMFLVVDKGNRVYTMSGVDNKRQTPDMLSYF